MTDTIRAAFEAWYSDDGANPKAVERSGDTYKLAQAAYGWWVWKTATANQWRPIADAPMDGTRILLTDGESVSEGSYLNIAASITEQRDIDGRYIDQTECDGFEGWMDTLGGIEPTHFMPLPLPPTGTGGNV